MQYDVAVIGAGVCGAMITRELSKLDLNLVMLEKCNDIAMGTSKANSAIVHAGFDAETGSLKAKLNVQGASLMAYYCNKLSVPYKNIGSLVIAFSWDDMQTLETLFERGFSNGVPNMEIISQEQLREMEPYISPEAVGALWAPTAGVVSPYELAIAATENAIVNGARVKRNSGVFDIEYKNEMFFLSTASGVIKAKYVINCAGVFADQIAKMIGDDSFKIIPRKGEYYLLDKTEKKMVNHVLFQCPSSMGKGILVTPTAHGNVLMGPTAIDLDFDSKLDVDTTIEGLDAVKGAMKKVIPGLTTRNAITSFAGLRAHIDGDNSDFVIARSKANDRFINVAGIESPGLTAAPAIARYVGEIFREMAPEYQRKEHFASRRAAPVRVSELTLQERAELIKKDSRYGRIICRCEGITEGEIIDAIKAPCGARDVDGVKRRTRAGMGRCQSGFCGSKVVEILARELDLPMNQVTKFGNRSKIVFNKTK
ncbi:MAG: NAD(P)/FAD-dependent oxidoreductase [Oscillospiraceae bacterium]|nr:NAD(P)/FAD-dependent oxidoreductase [Oscillospiraceae bacterium]MDD6146089.1 NAD(P)/FAD-dependent oxidoreductase [Oscillospiraceae bacterium]